VIFAWGTNTIKHQTNKQYKEAKDEVKKICKNKNLKMVAGGKKEPLHGQRWSNKSELVNYKE
jgi:RNase H-fold protein (predicted Holliday junction resolvase)